MAQPITDGRCPHCGKDGGWVRHARSRMHKIGAWDGEVWTTEHDVDWVSRYVVCEDCGRRVLATRLPGDYF